MSVWQPSASVNYNLKAAKHFRHQHRRHDDESCEFGRFFPANKFVDFERACQLFGLANMLRLLRCVEPAERQAAADSIMREAVMWQNEPIDGVYGKVLRLTSQIKSSENELERVNALLSYHRDRARE
ncbi:hypothetical protein Fmac_026647 [Flemingia macrophylla]|uniref:LOB domain-containing protein n=1 Tax=Flemingia macrophylla TaxID=520843 RepID=A0ABD1LFP9_9FABA